MGAAEDGRAPTEELSCVRDWASDRRGVVEDGRAPTEDLSSVRNLGVRKTKREGADLPQDQRPCLYLSSPMEN